MVKKDQSVKIISLSYVKSRDSIDTIVSAINIGQGPTEKRR